MLRDTKMRYLRRFNESNESSIEILDYISDILTDITDEGIEYDIYTASRKSYHFDGEITSQEWLKEHGINIYDVSQFGQWLYNLSEMNLKSMPSSFYISFESESDSDEENATLHKIISSNKDCIERLINYLNSVNYTCYEMTCFSFNEGRNKWTSTTNIDELITSTEGEDIAEYEFRFKLG